MLCGQEFKDRRHSMVFKCSEWMSEKRFWHRKFLEVSRFGVRRQIMRLQENVNLQVLDLWMHSHTWHSFHCFDSVAMTYTRSCGKIWIERRRECEDSFLDPWSKQVSTLRCTRKEAETLETASFNRDRWCWLKVVFVGNGTKFSNIGHHKREALPSCPELGLLSAYILKSRTLQRGSCRSIYNRWICLSPRDGLADHHFEILTRSSSLKAECLSVKLGSAISRGENPDWSSSVGGVWVLSDRFKRSMVHPKQER